MSKKEARLFLTLPDLHPRRVLIFDALRGLGLLGVLAFHFAYDLSILPFIFSNFDSVVIMPGLDGFASMVDYLNRVLYLPVMTAMIVLFSGMFLFVSGICTVFSRNNLRHGIEVLIAAALVSLVTYAGSKIFADSTMFIRFGILHCIGFGLFTYGLAEFVCGLFHREVSANFMALLGLLVIFVGVTFQTQQDIYQVHQGFDGYLRAALGLQADFSDWFPIFPYTGVLYLGIGLGHLYREPIYSIKEEGVITRKILAPLCAMGRHSIYFYLFHQLVYIPLILLLFMPLGFRLSSAI